MTTERCTKCGMLRADWKDNSGLGHVANGQTFCCRGCAEGRGCTCR